MEGYQKQDFRKIVDDIDCIILKLPCQHLICDKCAKLHHQQLSYFTCFICSAAYFQKPTQFPQVEQNKLQQKYEIGCVCENEKKQSQVDIKLEEIEQSIKRKENEVIGQFMSSLYNLILQKTVKIQKSINEKTKEKMQNYEEIMQIKRSFQINEVKSKEIEFIEPKNVVNAADEEFLQHIIYEKQRIANTLNVCMNKIKQLNSPFQYEPEEINQEQNKSKSLIEEQHYGIEGTFNQALLNQEESQDQNSALLRNDQSNLIHQVVWETNKILLFNIETEKGYTQEVQANIPNYSQSVMYQGDFIIVGGFDKKTSQAMNQTIRATKDSVQDYPKLLQGRCLFGICLSKDVIYVAGGQSSNTQIIKKVEKLDLLSPEEWKNIEYLPQELYGNTLIVDERKQKIYSFGGINTQDQKIPYIYEYQITKDQ